MLTARKILFSALALCIFFSMGFSKEGSLSEIKEEVLTRISEQEEELAQIREESSNLFDQWEQFLEVTLPTKIDVLKQYGYEASQKGINQFNQDCAELQEGLDDLSEVCKEKWNEISEKAFGRSLQNEGEILSIETIESIFNKMHEELESSQFAADLRECLNDLPDESDVSKKHEMLKKMIQEKKQEILKEFGIKEESDFVQFAKELEEHYQSFDLREKAQGIRESFYQKLGIDKP